MEERLQKILARAGVASRRHAEELIARGRVTVNGAVVRELGSRADGERDAIAVDGRPVQIGDRRVYLMLHKPPGYVTTASDPEGRPTVYELVPPVPGLFTVGRLDRDTEGLLLLTTDGAWAERIAHPRFNVEREYEVHVRGPITERGLEALREGIVLEGRPARPLAAYESGRAGFASILTIVMAEGRRREVRLLCAGAGISVKRLIRRRFGSLLLGWLQQGDWRYLDSREVAALADGPAHRSGTGGGRRGPRSDSERWREQRGVSSDEPARAHRDRRSGGIGEIDDRSESGRDARFSVPGHRGDVSRGDRAGARGRDRPGR